MVKRTGPTNIRIRKLITLFKKLGKEKNLFKKLAEELNKPRRKKKGVNLWKIQKYANENDVIIVPEKLLAYGDLTKNVKIFALDFSQRAIEKLRENNIEFYYLEDLPNFIKKGKWQIKIIK